eukprot:EG_transcript_12427
MPAPAFASACAAVHGPTLGLSLGALAVAILLLSPALHNTSAYGRPLLTSTAGPAALSGAVQRRTPPPASVARGPAGHAPQSFPLQGGLAQPGLLLDPAAPKRWSAPWLLLAAVAGAVATLSRHRRQRSLSGSLLPLSSVALMAASGSPAVVDAVPQPVGAGRTAALKTALLEAVANLDRGLEATAADQQRVETACRALEAVDTAVAVSRAELQGRWRLLYSSGFARSQTLGGSRPGPPKGILGLGPVFQVFRPEVERVDNTVELTLPALLPGVAAPTVKACLQHRWVDEGARGTRIVFDRTEVQGGFLPAVTLPELPEFLKPPAGLRSAAFVNTFCDADLRISRGDRDELRVYRREPL